VAVPGKTKKQNNNKANNLEEEGFVRLPFVPIVASILDIF
jgi:hypothetical protein